MIEREARALLERRQTEPRRIRLPFGLPGRNELDAAGRAVRRVDGRWFSGYDVLKRKAHEDVILCANRCPAPPARGPVWVVTRWRERDRRRDPDNIVSGGRKLILDALGPGRRGLRGWKGAGLLHCDGWHCVAAFVDVFEIGEPAVEVILPEVQLSLFAVLPAAETVPGRVELRADLRAL